MFYSDINLLDGVRQVTFLCTSVSPFGMFSIIPTCNTVINRVIFHLEIAKELTTFDSFGMYSSPLVK